jgi:hypothetical protein
VSAEAFCKAADVVTRTARQAEGADWRATIGALRAEAEKLKARLGGR